jgi:hypothetical protein
MSKLYWPEQGEVPEIEAFLGDARCIGCGGRGTVDDVRRRKLRTLGGRVKLRVPIRKCIEPSCPLFGQRLGGEVELSFAPPHWTVSWDLFAWMGHRRFGRHWSVPQIRHELEDRFAVDASEDWIEDYLARYQAIVAGRESDIELMKKAYAGTGDLILTIDGLQPEKGHETLYVVREVRLQRIWFAQSLPCSSQEEVGALIERAKQMADALGKKVRCWMSDKQHVFVKCLAETFPGVPHRYCNNHFLRDLAKPILDKDGQAKVQMRSHVRGLRRIEKRMLSRTHELEKEQVAQTAAAGTGSEPLPAVPSLPRETVIDQHEAVLDYCACVRGILNDDQGGPLLPAGVRMDLALQEVQDSLDRVLSPGRAAGESLRSPRRNSQIEPTCRQELENLCSCIERGRSLVADELQVVRQHTEQVTAIWALLSSEAGPASERRERFSALATQLVGSSDPVQQHMGQIMFSFVAGLFVGDDEDEQVPVDNLELERALRVPKAHERHVHGHAHAGMRIVHQGATLALVLDAHQRHPGPFHQDELIPYLHARLPDTQLAALQRQRIMRQGRSTQRRAILLSRFEARFRGKKYRSPVT